MEEQDPVTVLIDPREILAEYGMEITDELLVTTYTDLADQYERAGYEPMLLKRDGEAGNA